MPHVVSPFFDDGHFRLFPSLVRYRKMSVRKETSDKTTGHAEDNKIEVATPSLSVIT
jgi:hypothetical protein